MRTMLLVLLFGLLLAVPALADEEEIIEIVDELDPVPPPATPEPVVPPPNEEPLAPLAPLAPVAPGNAVPPAVAQPVEAPPTKDPCCPIRRPVYCSPCAPRSATPAPCPPRRGRYYGSCSYPGPIFDFGG